MKKKKILLLTSIASIATFSAAAILFSNQSNVGIKADDEVTIHEIDFNSLSSYSEPDSSGYVSFSLFIEKGIGKKYDISTKDGETYFYTDNLENVNYLSTENILEMPGSWYASIRIQFRLIYRATLDLSESVVNIEADGVYQNANKFMSPADAGDGTNNYTFYWDSYHLGYSTAHNIVLKSVHLEFSCPK